MIALGSDHGGYGLKQEVIKHLEERGIEYKDYGCYSEESCDYPIYGKKVAEAVAGGECEFGIIIAEPVSAFPFLQTRFRVSGRHFAMIASVLRRPESIIMPIFWQWVPE